MNDEPDLRDLYGTCARTPCACLTRPGGWLGRACRHWQPLGPRTIEELQIHQRRVIGERLAARKKS